MELKDPDHPFWKWAMHGTYLGSSLLALVLFSTTFDATEMKSLGVIVGSILAAGGAKHFVTRQAEKND
jgi:hypothetical protein